MTNVETKAKPSYDWNKLNLFALLSLVLSVTGLHIPGIVLGHIALVQLRTDAKNGRALAIAGLVIGYATIALMLLAMVAFFVIGAIAASRGQYGPMMMGPFRD